MLFNIAVQKPFQPQWSRLLLHDYELFTASFALCFQLLIFLQQASNEFVSAFPSTGHFSLSGTYPLDSSGLGDPTTTVCLTLRITGTCKPLHHGRLEIPLILLKVNIWSIALCGAEAWALRKVDQ